MSRGDGAKEFTLEDIVKDLRLVAKAVKTIRDRNEAMEQRLEAIESLAKNGEPEDEDFSDKDRKKALSVLADRVINPDDHMLPQMTETPDRMLMPMIIKHAQNEFLKRKLENPDSDVLFSDILMKWCDIKMRSRKRQLIGEAMGFSQIEMEKAEEEVQRGLEAQGEL